MKRRVVVTLCLIYSMGIFAGYFLNIAVFPLLTIIIVIIAFIGFFGDKIQHSSILVLLLIFLLGVLSISYKKFSFNQDTVYFDEKYLQIKGVVSRVGEQTKGKDVYRIDLERVKYRNQILRIEHSIILYYTSPSTSLELLPGDRITAWGKAYLPTEQRNPWGFDQKKYLQGQGITALFFADKIKKLNGINYQQVITRFITKIRRKVLSSIDSNLPKPYSSLYKGILLGDKQDIEDTVIKDLSNIGIIHVFTVSGLHVGFLLTALFFIFKKKFLQNTKAQLLITALLLLLFVLITGGNPPVIRASLMAFIPIFGSVTGREKDLISSAFFAALLMLVVNPFYLFMVSFQMSFTAVLGILLLSSRLNVKKLELLPKWLTDLISVTLAAQLGLLPLMMYYFNKVSLIAPIANLILVPLAGVCVITGFISIILVLLFPFTGVLLKLGSIFLWVLLKIAQYLADLPWVTVELASPSVFAILMYYVIILFASGVYGYTVQTRKIIKVCFLSLALFIVTGCFLEFFSNQLHIIFFDVGQGDSIFIETPGNKRILVDTGTDSQGEHVVCRYLKKEGIHKLDMIIISHFHEDHYGGLLHLVDEIKIDRIVISYPGLKTLEFKRFSDKHNFEDTKILAVSMGDRMRLGNVVFDVFHPLNTAVISHDTDLNNTSLVFKMVYNNFKVLFTGDLENQGEMQLLKRNFPLDADILKVAHHGSKDSTDDRFVSCVKPVYAIISVGDNKYGHPHYRVAETLKKFNTRVYRTDKHGAIYIKSNGSNFKINPIIKQKENW